MALTVFNVKNYGAKGDSTTDDTAAIQSAITVAINAGGGNIYFPKGIYLNTGLTINSTVPLFLSGDEVFVSNYFTFGNFSWLTNITGSVLRNTSTTNDGVLLLNTGSVNISNLGFVGNGNTSSNGFNFGDFKSNGSVFTNIVIANYSSGIFLSNSFENTFNNLETDGCLIGINSANPLSNNHTFNNWNNNFCNKGAKITNGYNYYFYNGVSKNNDYCFSVEPIYPVNNIYISGFLFDQNRYANLLIDTTTNTLNNINIESSIFNDSMGISFVGANNCSDFQIGPGVQAKLTNLSIPINVIFSKIISSNFSSITNNSLTTLINDPSLGNIIPTVNISNNYNVQTKEFNILVDTSISSITVNLPSSPSIGRILTIKDRDGYANTNHIIVNGNGKNIDGYATLAINTIYGSSTLLFNNNQWNIMSVSGAVGGAAPTGPASGDLIGSYPSPSVAKLQGSILAAPVSSGSAYKLLHGDNSGTLNWSKVDLANDVTGILSAGNQASQSLGGDLSGTTASATVTKIQGRSVSPVAPIDGYVLVWDAADGYWNVRPPASIIAEGKVYEFGNIASADVAGYFRLESNATGSEGDLSVAINSTSGQVLIKSFVSNLGSPDVTYIPAGQWDFDFYRYVDVIGGTTQLIFNVYTRTLGGLETLLFSVTSNDINDISVASESMTHSFPTDTIVNSTDRIVVKVFAQTTSVSNINAHFVFDGNTHASHLHTPIIGAAVTLGGDLIGNTGNATVLKINGSSVPAGGALTTGNVLQVSGISSLTYGAVNLAGGSNYVTGNLPTTNIAPGTAGQIFVTNATPTSAWTSLINYETVHGRFTAGGSGTDFKVVIGPSVGAETSGAALWLLANATAASGSNYSIGGDGTNTYINTPAPGTIFFQSNGVGVGNWTSSILNLVTPTLQWVYTTVSPIITQAALTSDVAPQNLTLKAQPPFGGATINPNAGDIIVQVSASQGATPSKFGGLQVQYNSSPEAILGTYLYNGVNYGGALWLGTAANAVNYNVWGSSTETRLNGPSGGAVNFMLNNAQVGSYNATSWTMGGTGTTSLNFVAGGTTFGTMTNSLWQFGTSTVQLIGSTLQWAAATASPTINQQAPSSGTAAGQNLTISPQSGGGTSGQPGSLLVNIAAPNGGSGEAFFTVQRAGVNRASLGGHPGNASYADLWLGPNVTPTNTNFVMTSDGTSVVQVNTPSQLVFSIANAAPFPINITNASGVQLGLPSLNWISGVVAPSISQQAPAGGTSAGQNLTITPQSGGVTSGQPGALILNIAAPNGASSENYTTVSRAGSAQLRFGQLVGYIGAFAGIYAGNVVPSSTNYGYYTSLDGTSVGLNAATQISLALGGSTSGGIIMSSSALSIYGQPTVEWGSAIVSPTLTQIQATSGAGVTMKIVAQAAATGSNANGGNLQLEGGSKDGTGQDGYVVLPRLAGLGSGYATISNAGAIGFSATISSGGISPGTAGQIYVTNATPASAWTSLISLELTHGRFTAGGSGSDYKTVIGPSVGAETSGTALWLLDHATAATGSNYSIGGDGTNTYINTVGAGTIFLQRAGVQMATFTSSTFTLVSPTSITWGASVGTPAITQTQNTTTIGQDLTITAQQGFTGFGGGNLGLYYGEAGSGNTSSQVIIGSNVTGHFQMRFGYTGAGTENSFGGLFFLPKGTATTLSAYSFLGDGTNTYFNAVSSGGSLIFRTGNIDRGTWSSAGLSLSVTPLTFAAGVTSPVITQSISTGGAGQPLIIRSQAAQPSSAAAGGNLNLYSGAGDGAGSPGAIHIGDDKANVPIWIGYNSGVGASSTVLAGNPIYIESYNGGGTVFSYQTVFSFIWSGAYQANFDLNNMQFAEQATTAALKLNAKTTDVLTHELRIKGQDGYNVGTPTNTSGGDIKLEPGASSTASGQPGNVHVYLPSNGSAFRGKFYVEDVANGATFAAGVDATYGIHNLWLGSGAGATNPTNASANISGDANTTYLNGGTSVGFMIGGSAAGTQVGSYASTSMIWGNATTTATNTILATAAGYIALESGTTYLDQATIHFRDALHNAVIDANIQQGGGATTFIAAPTVTALKWGIAAQTSNIGTSDLTLYAQSAYAGATSTSRNGGNVHIQPGAGSDGTSTSTQGKLYVDGYSQSDTTSVSTHSAIVLTEGGNNVAWLGTYSSTFGALWLKPAASPALTSYSLLGDGQSTYLNATSNAGNIYIGMGGSYLGILNTTAWSWGTAYNTPQYTFDISSTAAFHFTTSANTAAIYYASATPSNPLTYGITTGGHLIQGAVAYTTKTFATTGTIDTTTTDSVILADTSSAAFVLTLPTPTNGRRIVIKDKTQSFGTHNLTVARHGTEKIDGVAASLVLSITNQEIVFRSDGTDWYTTNFASATTGPAGGDLSGTYPNPTVAKVNGATVPAAGALTTGNVLQVNGVSSLTYGPVNLAGGANYVSGNLPVANIAPGTAGQIFVTNASPASAWTSLINYDTTHGTFTSGGSGTDYKVIIGPHATLPTTYGAVYLLPAATAAAAGNYTLISDGTSTHINNPTAGGAIYFENGGSQLSYQSGASAVWHLTSIPTIEWDTAVVSPKLYQANLTTASGTGATMTIQAQNETGTTSTGGDLVLTSGTGTTVPGALRLQLGGTAQINISSVAGVNTTTIYTPTVTFERSVATPRISQSDLTTVSGTGQTLTIQAQNETGTTSTGGALVLTTGTGTTTAGVLHLQTGGTDQITIVAGAAPNINITPSLVQWVTATAAPTLKQADTTGVGATMTVQAQNTSGVGGQAGGSLDLTSGSAASAALAGNVLIQTGGTTRITVAPAGITVGTTGQVNALVGSYTYTTRLVNASPFTIDSSSITDYILDVDTSGTPGGITITLPIPTNGRTIILRDITGSFGTNNCTLAQHSTEKINGLAASKILSANWGSWTITSNGTDWFVM